MLMHCNTTVSEFVDYLRDTAIRNREAPQYIDAIDRLDSYINMEWELEKLGDELCEMEKSKDDLYAELEDLLTALDNNLPPDAGREIENAIKIARAAIERHDPRG